MLPSNDTLNIDVSTETGIVVVYEKCLAGEYLHSNAKSVKFKANSSLHGNHRNINMPFAYFPLGF